MSATPPMGCADTAPYLSAYLDGELAEPTREAVSAHVADCAACRKRLDRLAQVDGLIASMAGSEPAPDLLERVQAATQLRRPRPAVRESLRRRERRVVSRGLPGFLLMDDSPAPAAVAARRRRSAWVTAALPALAAVVILSMTVAVFHRLPSGRTVKTTGKPVPTAVPLGTAIEQTQWAVSKYSAQLAFRPALPTYLPPYAQAPTVAVGPENAGIASHVLDVVWKWSCATCQVSEVHLRETAVPLASRNDWGLPPPEPGLSWQLPGANPWRPGTLQDTAELGRWAVGQDRTGYSITLDVAGTSADPGGPSDVERNALRLISLSMDLPYEALTVTPPNFATTEVQFMARSLASGVSWSGVVAPGGLEKVAATGPGGQYTDVSNGTTTLRTDTASGTYATMPAGTAQDLTFSTETQQFFLDANTSLSYGELWPLPGTTTFGGVSARRLFLVGAPYATYVYVATPTPRLLGASVDYSLPMRPGGAGASSQLTPASGCPSYAQVLFQPWSAGRSGEFSVTTPKGYVAGSTPRSVTC